MPPSVSFPGIAGGSDDDEDAQGSPTQYHSFSLLAAVENEGYEEDEEIVGFKRYNSATRTEASKCQVRGDGLQEATVRAASYFWIETFDQKGVKRTSGGDVFFVAIRGPSQSRARVTDNEDGTYLVVWKPHVSGVYTVAVSLFGELLPGAPFVVHATTTTPCATKCTVRGEALNVAVSRAPQKFEVLFKDRMNQISQAVDLDVFVEPIPPTSPRSRALAIKTADIKAAEEKAALEKEKEGSSKEKDMSKKVKVDKRAAKAGKGAAAAASASASAFTAVAASAPAAEDEAIVSASGVLVEGDLLDSKSNEVVRTRTMRVQVNDKPLIVRSAYDKNSEQIGVLLPGQVVTVVEERVAEGGEVRACIALDSVARAIDGLSAVGGSAGESASTFRRIGNTSPKLVTAELSPGGDGGTSYRKSGSHGSDGSTNYRKSSKGRSPRARASATAASPFAASSPVTLAPAPAPSSPFAAPSTSVGYDAGPSPFAGATTAAEMEAAAAAYAAGKAAKSEAAANAEATARADVAAEADGGAKSDWPATIDAPPANVVNDARLAAEMEEAVEAVRQKLAEGHLLTADQIAMLEHAAAIADAAALAEAAALANPTAPADAIQDTVWLPPRTPDPASAPAASAVAVVPAPTAPAAASAPSAPPPPTGRAARVAEHYNKRALLRATLATRASNAFMRAGRDSKAAREVPQDDSAASANTPQVGWVTLVKSGKKLVSSRVKLGPGSRRQYLSQWARRKLNDKAETSSGHLAKTIMHELTLDPSGIGFAFGGVEPGVLHAHGQLHEVHNVSYSIGLAGHYWLHVRLRQQATSVPGSPFHLHVLPGQAHAKSTRVSQEPLNGMVGGTEDTGCSLILHAADRVGNQCSAGGANLQILCDSKEMITNVEDFNDGTYKLRWNSKFSGTFKTRVVIDMLDVIGSPREFSLTSSTPNLSKSELTGDGLKTAIAGSHSVIRIAFVDEYGNTAVPDDSFTFGMSFQKDREKLQNVKPYEFEGHWDPHTRGVYEIRYVATASGGNELQLWCDPNDEGTRTAFPGSPFHVLVTSGKASPATSQVDGWTKVIKDERGDRKHGADMTVVHAGDTINVKPQIFDEYGNHTALPEDAMQIFVNVPDNNGKELVCNQTVKGGMTTYDARYDTSVAGAHSVSITLFGNPIVGSPVTFNVLPDKADPVNSKFLMPPESPLFLVDHEYACKILCYDKFGNKCISGGLSPGVRLQVAKQNVHDQTNLVPSNHTLSNPAEDQGNGEYLVKFQTSIPVMFKVFVNIDKNIPSAGGELPPLSIVIVADPEAVPETEGEPSGAAGGGRRRSQGNEKLKQAVGEVIQGFGSSDERRDKDAAFIVADAFADGSSFAFDASGGAASSFGAATSSWGATSSGDAISSGSPSSSKRSSGKSPSPSSSRRQINAGAVAPNKALFDKSPSASPSASLGSKSKRG